MMGSSDRSLLDDRTLIGMLLCVFEDTETENVGFEPTVPFGNTGFQDRRLKPLGQLSKERKY